MFWYSSNRSVVMVEIVTLARGGGWYEASLYHPLIRIHTYKMRCGLDVINDSTEDTPSAAFSRRSSWMLALIVKLISLDFFWSPLWHATTLVLIRRQVYGDIHSCWSCYLRGRLRMPPRSTANRQSTPSGVIGVLMG